MIELMLNRGDPDWSSIDCLETADSAVLGGLGASCWCVSLFDLPAFGENMSFLILGKFFPGRCCAVVAWPGLVPECAVGK